ncbi:MAG: 50S ribosomal protein L7/L12 [Anaerolineaceae bacterium 4572_32.1]|nr:MAG: 50S ribosomal protein L7/L12 [Anaerolineaceae bacterium 4572_32.1]
MASEKIEKIIAEVEQMTVLELAELVKAIEEKFEVSAAAPMAMMAAMPGAGAEAAEEEEKTEFDVVLTEIGPKKIQVIKAVRQITSLGLKDAKDLVDSAPSTIVESVPKETAEEIKTKIEAEGGVVELK